MKIVNSVSIMLVSILFLAVVSSGNSWGAPITVSITAPANPTSVSVNTVIKVTFSELMDTTTIGGTTNFTVSTGSNGVAGDITFPTQTTAVFTPSQPLAYNTLYTVKITTGVRSLAGDAMAAPFTSTFTTKGPPTVSFTSPKNGNTSINVETSIDVTFSEIMDTSTIDGTTFFLSGGVTGTFKYTNSPVQTIVSFKPTQPLANNTTYTATITTGVKNLDGRTMLASKTWSFTTGPPTPLQITGKIPAPNAQNVSTAQKVIATFNQAMDQLTINGLTFTLSAGGTPINATVTYSAVSKTATLSPLAPLTKNRVYTATLGTAIKSFSGQGLQIPESWTFATGVTLSATLIGTGAGTIPELLCTGSSCLGVYDANSSVTLTATPRPDSYFAGWGGACNGTGACVVPLDVAKSVTATFNVRPTLAATLNGTGAGTIPELSCNGSSCLGVYDVNSLVTLTATPFDGGSKFAGWGGACSGTGACVVTLDVAKSITATFNDVALPTLIVSTLSDLTSTSNGVLNIAGKVTDNMAVNQPTITINANPVTVQPDGTFTSAIALGSGLNTITTIAADAAGNQATPDVRKITLDPSLPRFTVSAPVDNRVTSISNLDVNGTIADATFTVDTKLNGVTSQLATITGTNYSATLILVPGINTVEIITTDQLGNKSYEKRTVTYNASAFTLSLTDPAADILTSENSIVVKGAVTDALSTVTLNVFLDGVLVGAPTLPSGVFQQTISLPTLPTEETFTIRVEAVDQSLNKVSAQRNVIRVLPDLTGDGVFGIADAMKALNISVGIETKTPEILRRGDVAPFINGQPCPDGNIDIGDVVVLLRKVVGLLTW